MSTNIGLNKDVCQGGVADWRDLAGFGGIFFVLTCCFFTLQASRLESGVVCLGRRGVSAQVARAFYLLKPQGLILLRHRSKQNASSKPKRQPALVVLKNCQA